MAIDESKAEQLRRRVAAERKAGGSNRVRFSAQLRRDAVELALTPGVSRERVAGALTSGSSSLHVWVTAAQRKTARDHSEPSSSLPSEKVIQSPLSRRKGAGG